MATAASVNSKHPASGSPTESLYGFTGEPTDANGLVHLRARYYDPALGVFPSLDPVEGNPVQPLSLGRYAYVQGNPINAVDPSGLFGETPGGFDSCFNFPIDLGESCNQCPEGWEVITSTRCLSRSDCAEALNSATRNRNLRQRPIVMCSRLGSVGFAAREELFNRADMPDPCSDRYPESESLFGPLLDVLGLSGALAVSNCIISGDIIDRIVQVAREDWTSEGIILGGEVSARVAGGLAGIFLSENGANNCRAYRSVEYGFGGGSDPRQVSVGYIYTTAELNEFRGETINFSGDAGLDLLSSFGGTRAVLAPAIARIQIPIGGSAGISISTDGNCNLTAYISPVGDGWTASVTRGLTYDAGECPPDNSAIEQFFDQTES